MNNMDTINDTPPICIITGTAYNVQNLFPIFAQSTFMSRTKVLLEDMADCRIMIKKFISVLYQDK